MVSNTPSSKPELSRMTAEQIEQNTHDLLKGVRTEVVARQLSKIEYGNVFGKLAQQIEAKHKVPQPYAKLAARREEELLELAKGGAEA